MFPHFKRCSNIFTFCSTLLPFVCALDIYLRINYPLASLGHFYPYKALGASPSMGGITRNVTDLDFFRLIKL